jgi:hypothetical protein
MASSASSLLIPPWNILCILLWSGFFLTPDQAIVYTAPRIYFAVRGA